MQKKLIALAVSAALAAPLAVQAEAKLYGKLHVALEQIGAGADVDREAKGLVVESYASRYGIKGDEDLGGGLKAVYKLEWGVDLADVAGDTTNEEDLVTKSGTPNVSPRNQFLGLKGGFGSILLGRHDTPYKMSTGKLDLLGDTVADYNFVIGAPAYNKNGYGRKVGNSPELEERTNDSLTYLSPKMMGGLTLMVGLQMDDSANSEDEFESFKSTSLAARYSAGPLFLAVANESWSEGLEQTGTRFGAGYKFGPARVGFVWEAGTVGVDAEGAEADAPGGEQDFTGILFNGAYNINKGNSLVFQAGTHEWDDGNDDTTSERVLTAFGFKHKFSKKTSAYVLYTIKDWTNEWVNPAVPAVTARPDDLATIHIDETREARDARPAMSVSDADDGHSVLSFGMVTKF